MEVVYLIFAFLAGFCVGAVIVHEPNHRRERKERELKQYEKLLNEREQLLDKRDTERYKVFKDTFKDN